MIDNLIDEMENQQVNNNPLPAFAGQNEFEKLRAMVQQLQQQQYIYIYNSYSRSLYYFLQKSKVNSSL